MVASGFKINRLQGIYSVRKQLQIYEQNDACRTLYAARCTPLPHSFLCTATHYAHQAVLSGWRR